MLKKSGHEADSIRFGVCACSRICSKEYTPAECRDNKVVEAAGIEHFARSIKTIGYKAAVPRSCLKISIFLAVHAMPVSIITKVGGSADF